MLQESSEVSQPIEITDRGIFSLLSAEKKTSIRRAPRCTICHRAMSSRVVKLFWKAKAQRLAATAACDGGISGKEKSKKTLALVGLPRILLTAG
jgi:hypothetical protein